jgi:hypothetical protein
MKPGSPDRDRRPTGGPQEAEIPSFPSNNSE